MNADTAPKERYTEMKSADDSDEDLVFSRGRLIKTQRKNLRQAVMELLDPNDYWNSVERDVYCTAVPGAYGTGYWMIVLNGSPPKGALLLQWGWSTTFREITAPVYFIDSQGRAKKVPVKREIEPTMGRLMILLRQIETEGMDRPRTFKLLLDGSLESVAP